MKEKCPNCKYKIPSHSEYCVYKPQKFVRPAKLPRGAYNKSLGDVLDKVVKRRQQKKMKKNKRYVIKIKIEKTLLIFAKSELEARDKIQGFLHGNEDSVDTISVEEVDNFFK